MRNNEGTVIPHLIRNLAKIPAFAGMTILMLTLASCYTPPSRYPVDNSKVYDMAYDKVWERVVEYFAVTNTPIKTIEKDSGIIFAEADFYTNEEADCGKMGRERIESAWGVAQYNAFVKKIGKNKTELKVNLRMSQAVLYNPLSRRVERVECISKGEIERSLLEFIEYPNEEVIFKFKERD